MGLTTFKITVVSASNLENVREFLQLKAYAIISIAGVKETEVHTPVDMENGTNPVWNFTTEFTLDEKSLHDEGTPIVIQLYCHRTLGDRYVGEVATSIKQLHDDAKSNEGGGWTTAIYKVHKGSVESQGELTLSYTFGDHHHETEDETMTFWEKLGLFCSCCEKNGPRADAVVKVASNLSDAVSDNGSKSFSIGSRTFKINLKVGRNDSSVKVTDAV